MSYTYFLKSLRSLVTAFAIVASGAITLGPFGSTILSNNLEIGDTALLGQQKEDGSCVFEDAKLVTRVENGETRWIALSFDESCKFVVAATWTGELGDGPSEKVDPLIDLLESQGVREEDINQPLAAASNESLVQSCKVSFQHVFMYGYGGTWDQLTHKSGQINFCYNGSTATIDSTFKNCEGSSIMYWDWLVDGCAVTGLVSGPASVVRFSSRGSYHCSPVNDPPCDLSNPDGYYHNLTDTEFGYGNGSSACTFGYTGQVAGGVSREIIAGCS